jgi:selT/selW/selH-like putative selenoprotein
VSLTEELLKHYEHLVEEIKLIPSDGGRFEVTVNGQLLYSKLGHTVMQSQAKC